MKFNREINEWLILSGGGIHSVEMALRGNKLVRPIAVFVSVLFIIVGGYMSVNAQTGSSKENAIPAVADTNTTNYNFADQWFKYTATRNGRIVVRSCGLTTVNTAVIAYKELPSGNIESIDGNDDACGQQSLIGFPADSGVTYYFVWRIKYASGSFKWLLKEEDLQPGDNCNLAIKANLGNNTVDNSSGDKWFWYTASAFKKLTISTCGQTSERTIAFIKKGDCQNLRDVLLHNLVRCGNQESYTFPAEEGETYYIDWKSYYTTGTYTWQLREEDYQPGEICRTALPAVVGTNTADNAMGDQWFTYTATRTGKTIISSCGLTTANTGIEVYTGSCSNLIYVANNDDFCGDQSLVQFEADSGVTYYIRWSGYFTSESYNWTISEEDWLPGEICSTAITAQTDTNVASINQFRYQYFEFKAPRSSWVTISNCGQTPVSTDVTIYKYNCRDFLDVDSNPCDTQTNIGFAADSGATYYIYWYASAPDTFKWTLTLDNLSTGHFCSSAYIAKVGENIAEESPTRDNWYKYTATKNCKVVVSSCGLTDKNTYVDVLKGNCVDLEFLDTNDDGCGEQSSLSFQADSGMTYYILWGSDTNEPFNWRLSEQPINTGDFCSVAIPAILGTNSVDNSSGDQWFVFKAVQNTTLSASSCDLTTENTAVGIYYGQCDELQYYSFHDDDCDEQAKVVFPVDSGQTYFIVWYNIKTHGSFNWTLLEEGAAPGNISDIKGPTHLCIGQKNVTYSIEPVANATNYVWTLPNGTNDTTFVASISIPEISASFPSGVISVYAFNQIGSTDTASINIVVNAVPNKPTITKNGVTLQSSADRGNQWYNLSGLIAGATDKNYTVGQTGKYYVIVTINGCSSEPSDTVNVIINSISEINKGTQVNIYPNPVNDELTITCDDKVEYEIYNIVGSIIAKGSGKNKIRLDAHTWNSGTYIIKLTTNNNTEYIKIIKQKQ